MNLNELKNSYKLIDLFVELAEIPSPSTKEEQLSEKILEICKKNGIDARHDDYQNVIIKIPAMKGYEKAASLLLSAHMDVIGDSSPVNVRLSDDGKYIETDKKRTLGADNKVGVAAILDLAIDMSKTDSQIPHGPIEITFTRDEEFGMTGIRNIDTTKLDSKYAIVADGEYLGEHDREGAGFTKIYIHVYDGKGGHSGLNIDDPDRVNAVKVLSEIDTEIPQGVYYKEPEVGVITSINAGVSAGGALNLWLSDAIKDIYESGRNNKPISEKFNCHNLIKTIVRNSPLNIISPEAAIAYSIRSSDPDKENELIGLIRNKVDTINQKYSGKIKVTMDILSHLKPFIRSEDTFLSDVIIEAGKKTGVYKPPGSFHAGAETHILYNEKKNSRGESFIPVLLGLANLADIHSSNEKLDWNSFLTGREWLENIVEAFAENSKKY